jgi:peptidyl-prolyl cis-trans isomerase D
MEFQQVGLEFSDAVGLFRNGFVEGISPGMVTKVFALENNGIARDSGEDAVYIARLSSVVAFDPTHQDSLPLIASVTQQRNDQLQQDFIERFVVAIQNEVGVTIDQSALNAVQTSVGAPMGHGG